MDNPEQQGHKSPEKGVDPPGEDENANPPAAEDGSPVIEPDRGAGQPDRGAGEPDRGAANVPSTSNVGAVGGFSVMASGSGACGIESLPLVARNPLLTKMLGPPARVSGDERDEMAAKRLKYSPHEEERNIVHEALEEDEEEEMEDEEDDEEDMDDDAERHRRLIVSDRSPPQRDSDDECLNRKL